MKPFTYTLLELLQRADEALRLERLKSQPRKDSLMQLALRKARLSSRLRRSLSMSTPAWS